MMNETTFLMLKIVVIVLSCLIGYGIKKYLYPIMRSLKEKLQKEDIWDEIMTAVEAAEQIIKESGQGAAKKEKVRKYILDWLNEKGIDMTAGQLDQLIESAVYNMNNGKELGNLDVEKLKKLLSELEEEK